MKNEPAPFYDVVGIGRAYIDVIAPTSYDLLQKYDIPLDTGRYFDANGIEEVKAQLPKPVYFPGGTIPNTLSGLAALGAKTGYFGKIADDPAGHVFQADLAARGIAHLSPAFVKNAPLSGTCIVLLTEGGERSFALHKGCVDSFTLADFETFDFGATRFLLLAANLLSNADTSDVFAEILRRAARASCQVVLSLSEVRDWKGRDDLAREAAKLADIFIGNEAENEAFFKLTGGAPSGLTVTTRGANGASARRGQETEIHVPSAPVKRFVSSLGAGDQFLAGFLYGEGKGLPLEESLKLAVRCAAAIIEETEARPAADADWSQLT